MKTKPFIGPLHVVNSFVDDSFNTIAFEPSAKIKTNLERYIELMYSYYDANTFQIIPEKKTI